MAIMAISLAHICHHSIPHYYSHHDYYHFNSYKYNPISSLMSTQHSDVDII